MDKQVNNEPSKKSYSAPELTVYGNAHDLTKTNVHGDFADGGRFPKTKGTALR